MRSFLEMSLPHARFTLSSMAARVLQRSTLAFASLILAAIALPSAAECPITLSVSRIGPTSVRITADGGGGCGTSQISVFVKDPNDRETSAGSVSCVDSSCIGQPLHFETTIGTTCKLSGTYTVRALAECLDVGTDGMCNVGTSQQATGGSFVVDSKPRLTEFSINGPDGFGYGSRTASWTFPPEAMGLERAIHYYSRTAGTTSWAYSHATWLNGTPESGSDTIGVSLYCKPDMEYRAVLSTCFLAGGAPAGVEFTDEAFASSAASPPPSISFGGVDAQGRLPLSFSFPQTPNVAPPNIRRAIWIYRDGVLIETARFEFEQSGTMYVGIGCLSEGDHQFTAHAVSCPGLSDGDYADGNEDYASTSVNVRHTPSVSVKVALTGPNTARATVSYSYPSPASAGSIALDFLDQQQELVVGSLPSLTGLQQTGQRTFDFTPSGSFIRATAYACDGSSVENVAGLVGTCSVNGNEGAQ